MTKKCGTCRFWQRGGLGAGRGGGWCLKWNIPKYPSVIMEECWEEKYYVNHPYCCQGHACG